MFVVLMSRNLSNSKNLYGINVDYKLVNDCSM